MMYKETTLAPFLRYSAVAAAFVAANKAAPVATRTLPNVKKPVGTLVGAFIIMPILCNEKKGTKRRVVGRAMRLVPKAPGTFRAVELNDLLHVFAELSTITQATKPFIHTTVVCCYFGIRGLHGLAGLVLSLKLLEDTPSLIVGA